MGGIAENKIRLIELKRVDEEDFDFDEYLRLRNQGLNLWVGVFSNRDESRFMIPVYVPDSFEKDSKTEKRVVVKLWEAIDLHFPSMN